MFQETTTSKNEEQLPEPSIEQAVVQEGSASNSLIQVGRDYIRYLQINFEGGNWTPILVNIACLGLIFYGLASATRSAVTYAADVRHTEGFCSPRMQKLALAFSREVALKNAALPADQRQAILDISDFQGPQGKQGERGPQGIKGDVGPQGKVGAQGAQGPKGVTGPQGPTGKIGPQGVPGLKGDKGDHGVQGIQGLRGEKGERGLTGAQGLRGLQGEQGLQGRTGPQGPRGAQGPRGSQGAQGRQGNRGPQGLRGARGPQGEPRRVQTLE